jgi:hypothetical protein
MSFFFNCLGKKCFADFDSSDPLGYFIHFFFSFMENQNVVFYLYFTDLKVGYRRYVPDTVQDIAVGEDPDVDVVDEYGVELGADLMKQL